VKNEKHFSIGIDGLILDAWRDRKLYRDKTKTRRAVRLLKQLNNYLQNTRREFKKHPTLGKMTAPMPNTIFAYEILKEASAEQAEPFRFGIRDQASFGDFGQSTRPREAGVGTKRAARWFGR
jgi:hypothetical protein